ncbi:ferrous iron transport protein A [Weeksellaceae bacterium TAE3-ERU29]|nr:ferrous iron transport protein A [Weeksellaceae bacterium TAE3-ERU29]
MESELTLADLQKGKMAIIKGISENCKEDMRQRLLDLGFVKKVEVTIQSVSPLNNPIAYNIHNTLISLRKEDASNILIEIKE